jgi:hypothetical protein
MSHDPATQPLAEPAEASAEDGHVIMEGPDGFAVTLTAEAATITGERLIEAGRIARQQREPGSAGAGRN